MLSASQSKPKAAFTLVELIVAMGIFGMVLAGGLLGVQKGFELVDSSRHLTRSSQILQSELELLRTLPWATFSTLSSDELTKRFNEQIETQFGAGTYVGAVRTATAGTDKIEVRVNVRWTARSGRAQTASYTTYFSKRGVNDYYIN